MPVAIDPRSVADLGFERHIDVALRLHIPRDQAVLAARALGAFIADTEGFAARVAGLDVAADRTDITLAVSLGTTEQIRSSADASVRALRSLTRLVDSMSHYAPAFVSIPAPESAEARAAASLVAGADSFAWISATA
ncbi:MAG: hypothetical protein RL134_1020 [Actinomycetota bacterium]|jgi:hypothetical protein